MMAETANGLQTEKEPQKQKEKEDDNAFMPEVGFEKYPEATHFRKSKGQEGNMKTSERLRRKIKQNFWRL